MPYILIMFFKEKNTTKSLLAFTVVFFLFIYKTTYYFNDTANTSDNYIWMTYRKMYDKLKYLQSHFITPYYLRIYM